MPKVHSWQGALALVWAVLAASGSFSPAHAVCRGDCAGDGGVSQAELKQIVDIINLCNGDAEGCTGVAACTSADADQDGMLTARDLTAVIADDVLGDSPDCEASGLGTHVFTIAQTTSVTDPPTGFFSTGSVPVSGQTTEVTLAPSATMCPPLCGWYIDQPLRLVAGAVNPSTGIAPIHLAQDVVYGYRIIDNATTICVKLLAQGSTGQLDCDGGSLQDATLEVDSNFSAASTSATTAHVGNPSRPGALTLEVMATIDNTNTLASASDCATWTFGEPSMHVFTTETVTVHITEVASTGNPARYCSGNETKTCNNNNASTACAGAGTCSVIRLSRTAVPFNCATWTTPGGTARLHTGLFGEATQVGDTANIQRITD